MSTQETLAKNAGRRGVLRGLERPRAWLVLLVAIPFLAGFYLLLPGTGWPRTVAYPVYGIAGTLAVLLGVHVQKPIRAGSWRLIALALALLALGDIIYSVMVGDGNEVAYPSPADVAYLAGYVVLIGGILSLIRGRVQGGDRTPIIDAAILSAGAGSILWFAVIQPSLVGTVEPVVGLVSMAYPVMDLILLGLGLRVVLTAATRPRYMQLLFAGVAIYFVADLVYAVIVLNQAYGDGNPIDAGWIVGILFIGVAALHPSVADPITAAGRR